MPCGAARWFPEDVCVIKLEQSASNHIIVTEFESKQLNSPSAITIDKAGTLFNADRNFPSSERVTRWNKQSKVSQKSFYGDSHLNDNVLDATEVFYFAQTWNIAINITGGLYTIDSGNNRIVK
ncbi:unnamed protein product [Rotaria sp. Silwood2]|nr:unnamed protein product [Rotaria sp. Silwood2]